jgi:hypothetical protein
MKTEILLATLVWMGLCSSCDPELQSPSGSNRRIVRVLDREGMVQEEYKYLKEGRVSRITGFLRQEFRYNPDGDSTFTVQGSPFAYTFSYHNGALTQAIVERYPVCGCGVPNTETWTYDGFPESNCRISVERAWQTPEGPYKALSAEYVFNWDSGGHKLIIRYPASPGSRSELYFDGGRNNLVMERSYTEDKLNREVRYTYDDKQNPFFRLNPTFFFSPVFWSRNNVLIMHDRTSPEYIQYYYRYYDLVPVSYRIESLTQNWSSGWDRIYEYE